LQLIFYIKLTEFFCILGRNSAKGTSYALQTGASCDIMEMLGREEKRARFFCFRGLKTAKSKNA
jgi:hypothetical protein